MATVAAMFHTRSNAEEAVERLVSAGIGNEAITYLSVAELEEAALHGRLDGGNDRWRIWLALAKVEINGADDGSLATGIDQSAIVLVIADAARAERATAVLVEAGAVDLNDQEEDWRAMGCCDAYMGMAVFNYTIAKGLPFLSTV